MKSFSLIIQVSTLTLEIAHASDRLLVKSMTISTNVPEALWNEGRGAMGGRRMEIEDDV